MIPREMDIFLLGSIILCCVMAVFNAIKNRNRGWTNLILSVSFLVFAGTAYLYRSGASPVLVDVGIGILFVLLVVDFFFRAGAPTARKKR